MDIGTVLLSGGAVTAVGTVIAAVTQTIPNRQTARAAQRRIELEERQEHDKQERSARDEIRADLITAKRERDEAESRADASESRAVAAEQALRLKEVRCELVRRPCEVDQSIPRRHGKDLSTP